MTKQIQIYADGTIHRAGDKHDLFVTQEVIPTETSPKRERLGVYLRERESNPFSLQGGTGGNRVTDVSCARKNDSEFLRKLYTDLVISKEEQ